MFRHRSGPKSVGYYFDPNCLTLCMMVLLKNVFGITNKNQQTAKIIFKVDWLLSGALLIIIESIVFLLKSSHGMFQKATVG